MPENHHMQISIKDYTETIQHQANKGMNKYGQAVDPLENGRDWLQMANEEMVDGHQYLVAEKEKRKFIVSKIRRLLDYKENSVTKVEINYWLDVLEGKTNITLEK